MREHVYVSSNVCVCMCVCVCACVCVCERERERVQWKALFKVSVFVVVSSVFLF